MYVFIKKKIHLEFLILKSLFVSGNCIAQLLVFDFFKYLSFKSHDYDFFVISDMNF